MLFTFILRGKNSLNYERSESWEIFKNAALSQNITGFYFLSLPTLPSRVVSLC